MNTCKTCAFFRWSICEHPPYGYCHRYPRVHLVSDRHWCGEWSALPTPLPTPLPAPGMFGPQPGIDPES